VGAGGQTNRWCAGGRGIRRGLLALVVAGAVVGPLLAEVPPAAPADAGESVTVRILEASVDPAIVEIAPGSTVVWINEASAARSIIAADGSFDSGRLGRGDQFQFAFTQPGTVTYTVLSGPGVTGTVVVRDPTLPAPPVPAAAPIAAPTDFAYTGAGSALTGAAGVLVLGIGAVLLVYARRIGAMALSGLAFFLDPDDLLPSRRHRRELKVRARRARSRR
jgi:plastocyanin